MTAFTKVFAGINILGAAVSLILFIATWFTQGIIIAKAREHALKATQTRLEPVVRFLENSKLTEKLPASVEAKLRGELMDYQSDPEKWLLGMAEGTGERAKNFEFPEIKNPIARKGLAAITQRVSDAPEHFRRSFDNLILDLRIFCGTNAFAFLLAAWLLFVARNQRMRHYLALWSSVISISSGLGIYFYVNQSWLWNFLFNDYFTWLYPTIILLLAVRLFIFCDPMLKQPPPVGEK